jgi:hypothetical protein
LRQTFRLARLFTNFGKWCIMMRVRHQRLVSFLFVEFPRPSVARDTL